MATPRVDRRLAAVLAADVVGYARLMERDEDGTLARLKLHRQELIEPLIAEHNGRIVKLMGDGALCEFASVVDAVRCAVLIQQGMTERERGLAEDDRIRFLNPWGREESMTRAEFEKRIRVAHVPAAQKN